MVGEIEGDTKDVSYLNGKGMSDSEDDLVAEVNAWNNAIIDEILWY